MSSPCLNGHRPIRSGRTGVRKLTVISSLAKGADQIAARAVCDLVGDPEQRNRDLEAVLPSPQHISIEDFTDANDRDAFLELLSLDSGRLNTHPEPTVLCPDFPACPDPSDPARPLPREKAYAAAGRYVVDTSEIVVAVWDPTREPELGGTEATVRYAVNRGRVVLWINPANPGAGPFLLKAGAPHRSARRAQGPADGACSDAGEGAVQTLPSPGRLQPRRSGEHDATA